MSKTALQINRPVAGEEHKESDTTRKAGGLMSVAVSKTVTVNHLDL